MTEIVYIALRDKRGPVTNVSFIDNTKAANKRHQGNRSNSIDLICPRYSGFSTRRVNILIHEKYSIFSLIKCAVRGDGN